MPVNRPPRHGPPTEPDAAWNGNVKQALAQCQRIQDMIEDLPEDIVAKASDFFTSVAEGAHDLAESIERRKCVTPKQQKALDNWESGVGRWQKDED